MVEICFNCKESFDTGDIKYGDLLCPHCGVMNSYYKPEDKQDEDTI